TSGVTSAARPITSSARMRLGTAMPPIIGRNRTTPASRLAINAKSGRARYVLTRSIGMASCETAIMRRTSIHAFAMSPSSQHRLRVLDQPACQPRHKENGRRHHCHDLRHECKRLVLKLCDSLNQADEHTDNHAGRKNRPGDNERDQQGLASEIE